MVPPGPVLKRWWRDGCRCAGPPCRLTTGSRLEKATPSWASASSTRAAAAARSRFSFWRGVHQGRQLVGLEIHPPIGFRPDRGLLSATGAVKAWGTSPGRFRGVGLGVVQPAAAKANMLTERPRKIAFIELSSNNVKPDGHSVGAPSYPAHGNCTQIWRERPFNKGGDCKALSRPAGISRRFRRFPSGKWRERRAAWAGRGKMDGRTDGFTWGAPKPVRPSVLAVSLGGAPNGHKAKCIVSTRRARRGKVGGLKNCNGMSPTGPLCRGSGETKSRNAVRI